MGLEALYKKYFQKSTVFMYPILDIKRGSCAGPDGTYLSMNDSYRPQDAHLIVVYPNRTDPEFMYFKKTTLIKHPRLVDHKCFGEELVFVFDYTDLKSDWEYLVRGKYSMMSDKTKRKILSHYDKKSGAYVYMESYMYPEKYFPIYADLLGYSNDLILRSVGELCSKPDLEKEHLIITEKQLKPIENGKTNNDAS